MQIRIWLINTALLALVIVSGVNTYRIWIQPPQWQAKGAAGKKQPLPQVATLKSGKLPAESSFNAVTERNLFNPSRRASALPDLEQAGADDPASSTQTAVIPEETEVKINNQLIFLFGVVMADNQKKALVTNPFAKGQERKSIWIAPQQMLETYQVYDIEPKQVLLRKEGKFFKISMNAKSKPHASGAAVSEPAAEKPAVVHTGTPPADTQNRPKEAKPTPPADDKILMTPFGPIDENKK